MTISHSRNSSGKLPVWYWVFLLMLCWSHSIFIMEMMYYNTIFAFRNLYFLQTNAESYNGFWFRIHSDDMWRTSIFSTHLLNKYNCINVTKRSSSFYSCKDPETRVQYMAHQTPCAVYLFCSPCRIFSRVSRLEISNLRSDVGFVCDARSSWFACPDAVIADEAKCKWLRHGQPLFTWKQTNLYLFIAYSQHSALRAISCEPHSYVCV